MIKEYLEVHPESIAEQEIIPDESLISSEVTFHISTSDAITVSEGQQLLRGSLDALDPKMAEYLRLRARAAGHETFHKKVAKYYNADIKSVSIGIDSNSGGQTKIGLDRQQPYEQQLLARIDIALAGKAGEQRRGSFDPNGSLSDLEQAKRDGIKVLTLRGHDRGNVEAFLENRLSVTRSIIDTFAVDQTDQEIIYLARVGTIAA